MCTLTWFATDSGYELFFNRDERLSRKRATPPSPQVADGVQYLAPIDADAGGTWIAANERGLTVCLLNHYQYEQIATYKDWTSRGEIVRAFASVGSLLQAEQQFKRLDLDDYRAFRMFVIDLRGHNRLFVWDGHQPRVERNVAAPKSSSSVDAKHVKSLRRQLFVDSGLAGSTDRNEFIAYHASHSPSKSKESVCMHRDDAKTVSFSHLAVSAEKVDFSYSDGSPCEAKLSAPITLPVRLKQKAASGAAKTALQPL